MGQADELFQEFPPSVQANLKKMWSSMGAEQREEIEQILETFSPLLKGKLKVVRNILELLEDQYNPLLFPLRKIAILGPVNVGKTTLFNQFMRSKENHGKVSSIPGTTRECHSAGFGAWTLVDTPGADHGTNVGDEEKDKAINAAADADFLLVIFDASRGVTSSCRELYSDIISLQKPHVLVLNKIDLVRRELEGVAAEAANALGVGKDQLIPVSAARGQNIDRLVTAIIKADSRVLHTLGEIMPQYRRMLARRWILSAAGSAGVIGLAPLPLFDLIPLSTLQGVLVLNLAGIYGYKITISRAKELVFTFGAGIAARTLFEQLSKLLGFPGWMLAAAIAVSTTAAIGFAAEKWFETGEKVSAAKVSELSRKITDEIIPQLTSLGKKRPGKKKLEGAITKALDEIEDGGIEKKEMQEGG